MIKKVKRIIRKLRSFWHVMKGNGKVSFSQFGEDIIMLEMLERYKIKNVSYLDIGANKPVLSNNTYNFYLRGCTGVLIEPNAALCKQLAGARPKDKVLNFGIASSNQTEVDYYMFEEKYSPLNTFSKEEALNTEKEGIPVRKVIKLPLRDINDVLKENFPIPPTVLSLDVEGLDELILGKYDFEKYRPLLICVETVKFNLNKELVKRDSIIELLKGKGYFVYADTNVNTIFCSRSLLDKILSN